MNTVWICQSGGWKLTEYTRHGWKVQLSTSGESIWLEITPDCNGDNYFPDHLYLIQLKLPYHFLFYALLFDVSSFNSPWVTDLFDCLVFGNREPLQYVVVCLQHQLMFAVISNEHHQSYVSFVNSKLKWWVHNYISSHIFSNATCKKEWTLNLSTIHSAIAMTPSKS